MHFTASTPTPFDLHWVRRSKFVLRQTIYFHVEKEFERDFCKMSWTLTMYFLFLLCTGTSVSKESMDRKELMVIIAEEMESANIICKFNHEIKSLYLKRTVGVVMHVLYAADRGKSKNEASEYKYRTEYFQLNNSMATIRLHKLKKSDSDVYVCQGTLRINNNEERKNSDSIILAVKEKEAAIAVNGSSVMKVTKSSSSSWMLYVFIFESLLLVLALGYVILSRIDIKKYCKKGKGKEEQSPVYEDMTYSLKCNAMAKPNLYNKE
ncbi:uncharacterized protein LOC134394709 [Elgaria multicarinata webbii]|uniref:uncharacterized protein LOC134394709 n=1 Tax=Elgaria multicarinata webbii TaxID=159646 RepID=UPI002FCCF69A